MLLRTLVRRSLTARAAVHRERLKAVDAAMGRLVRGASPARSPRSPRSPAPDYGERDASPMPDGDDDEDDDDEDEDEGGAAWGSPEQAGAGGGGGVDRLAQAEALLAQLEHSPEPEPEPQPQPQPEPGRRESLGAETSSESLLPFGAGASPIPTAAPSPPQHHLTPSGRAHTPEHSHALRRREDREGSASAAPDDGAAAVADAVSTQPALPHAARCCGQIFGRRV